MQVLAAVCVLALLPVPVSSPKAASPRVILRLSVPRGGPAQVGIENAAATALVLSGVTYLTLSYADDPIPRYWAHLDTDATPSRHGAVRLPARGKMTASVDPADLLWAPDRTGMSAEQPLGRAVMPGPYDLHVQIMGPDGAWWRSNDVRVTVGRSGSLRYN